ncbi:MAG: crotonase/enoyl-CoA hydratase family protein [Desulfatiglans sp.]|jgi:enoyl-CoA hydratase|nr:crotonase/enoyl-CoA hydratase family protein [Thermodesulfobacteriota bacterium]MEE4352627.1 crotonase/enoyl-CoA hydratase family protein [Desulfatiglans sp.]
MTHEELFKIEKEGYITWLTLNRPEQRNRMTIGFLESFMELFDQFDKDPDVRAVIIKAEGKSFTAGMDVSELSSLLAGGGADSREQLRKSILHLQEGINVIERCRKPVIAAVHSHCIGGGIDMISACDIRIASKDVVFSIRETKIAIVADLGTLQRLPHIIGDGWFRELALTGRDFSGEEALKMGLITHLLEDRKALYDKAKSIAEEIVTCSPLAIQGVKDVILYDRDSSVHAGLEYVAQKNATLLPSEDMIEALQAFKEKRPPVFKGK